MAPSPNAHHPIHVHTFTSTGKRLDVAECDTPEDAVTAARTLLAEAMQAGAGQPRAAFYVDGKLVRNDVSISAVDAIGVALGAA